MVRRDEGVWEDLAAHPVHRRIFSHCTRRSADTGDVDNVPWFDDGPPPKATAVVLCREVRGRMLMILTPVIKKIGVLAECHARSGEEGR